MKQNIILQSSQVSCVFYKKFFTTIKNSCYFAVLVFCFVTITISDAFAYSNNEKLNNIAKSFVNSVNIGFKKADNIMQQIKTGRTNAVIQKTSDTISSGEELLFKILVGQKKIPLNFDIIAIKEENDILISLKDFFAVTDMAIKVKPENGTAAGWFIRENQDFFLDAKNEIITIMGTSVQMPSGSVVIKNDDIYATSYTISRWFNMKFIIDFQELTIFLTTSQALPIEERYARRSRNKSSLNQPEKPKLPYKKQPYTIFSIPSIDVNLRSSYSKFQNGRPIRNYAWSAVGSNDFAFLQTKTFIGGNEEDIVNNARITFTRESKKPDMLGFLQAQKISFGDIYSTRLPLTGNSVQEQGLRITNKSSRAISSFTTTLLRGNAQPDWDIELYRGDRFIAFQTVGEDGTYNFEDIRLFVGDNDFRLVFYGPQGEIEEVRENIPVQNSSIFTGESSYDISISRNNEITYRKYPFNEPEDGKPHIVARYDKNLGKIGVAYAGLRHRQEEYDKKTYIETGISTNMFGSLLNLSTALDATNGGAALDITTRKKIGKHSTSANLKINSKKYNIGNEPTSPITTKSRIDITGPVNISPISKIVKSTYGLKFEYWRKASGDSNLNLASSFGSRFGSTILNNSLIYTKQNNIIGNGIDRLEANLNIRGFVKRARWRFKTNYQIYPSKELRNIYAYISYPFTTNLEAYLQAEHFIASNRTEATVNLNWKTEKAIITPRITIDTNDTLRASVNARFGIGYEPQSHDISMYNKTVSNTGKVSARVFLDKDGDGIFGREDELLPNVELNAVQSNREATTNEKGIAFIPNLPENRLTDITLDKGTFEDPFWISNFKGISLKPRASTVTTLDFPIVVAGEIDGYVYLEDNKGNKNTGRQYSLHLIKPDGSKIQKTSSSYDGFYIFSTVPPGTYFLTADYNDAKATGYTMPAPKIVTITPDGKSIYGENITLVKGSVIDFKFRTINKPQANSKAVEAAPDTYTANILLGEYNSKLAMSVDWYKMKVKFPEIGRYFEAYKKPSEIKPNPKTGKYTLPIYLKNTPILDIETAHMVCTKIATKNIACIVEVISTYDNKITSHQKKNIYSALISKILN